MLYNITRTRHTTAHVSCTNQSLFAQRRSVCNEIVGTCALGPFACLVGAQRVRRLYRGSPRQPQQTVSCRVSTPFAVAQHSRFSASRPAAPHTHIQLYMSKLLIEWQILCVRQRLCDDDELLCVFRSLASLCGVARGHTCHTLWCVCVCVLITIIIIVVAVMSSMIRHSNVCVVLKSNQCQRAWAYVLCCTAASPSSKFTYKHTRTRSTIIVHEIYVHKCLLGCPGYAQHHLMKQ